MENQLPKYTIRPMNESDIPQVITMWGGHIRGVDSIRTYLQMDPGGLWVAVDDKGNVLARCGVLFLRPDLAYLGLYAVQEGLRGKGLGGHMLNVALDRIKKNGNTNCALNTVDKYLIKYRDRAGFNHVTSWRSGSFLGPTPCFLWEDDPQDQLVDILVEGHQWDCHLWESILEYDCQAVHGIRRDKLLELTRREESVTFAVCPGNKKGIRGYGVSRKNVNGHCLIGPLYADSYQVALSIVKTLVRSDPASERGLVLMTLDNNPGSVRLAQEGCGLRRSGSCVRLFKKYDPAFEPKYGGTKVYSQHDICFINF